MARWTTTVNLRPNGQLLCLLLLTPLLQQASSLEPQQNNNPTVADIEPDQCPESCFCDVADQVTCVGDQYQTPDLPSIPETTKRLQLRNFDLSSISDKPNWEHLVSLTDLAIEECEITGISNATWSASTNLEHLDIIRNPKLTEIGPGAFSGLTSLRALDLSANSIKNLPAETFSGLPALQHLSLSKNGLTSVDKLAFKGLKALRYLNLGANNLSSLAPDAFNNLESLARLILSENPLEEHPMAGLAMRKLHFLDLSSTGLASVPRPVTPMVRDLRLGHNSLEAVRVEDFENFPRLTLLVLDDNKISYVEDDALGRHEDLRQIWLNNNQLTTVPKSLPKTLKVLYLEENKLSKLEKDAFLGLTELDALYLRRNQIDQIADFAFQSLVALRTLNLVGNGIREIRENTFSGLGQLARLDLSQNPIHVVEAGAMGPFIRLKVLKLNGIRSQNITLPPNHRIFEPLERLEDLDLRGSKDLTARILSKPVHLKDLSNVRVMDLSNTGLTHIQPEILSLLTNLESLDLRKNPWDCSTEKAFDLAEALANLSRGSLVVQPLSLKCATPSKLQSTPLVLLKKSDLASTTLSQQEAASTVTPGDRRDATETPRVPAADSLDSDSVFGPSFLTIDTQGRKSVKGKRASTEKQANSTPGGRHFQPKGEPGVERLVEKIKSFPNQSPPSTILLSVLIPKEDLKGSNDSDVSLDEPESNETVSKINQSTLMTEQRDPAGNLITDTIDIDETEQKIPFSPSLSRQGGSKGEELLRIIARQRYPDKKFPEKALLEELMAPSLTTDGFPESPLQKVSRFFNCYSAASCSTTASGSSNEAMVLGIITAVSVAVVLITFGTMMLLLKGKKDDDEVHGDRGESAKQAILDAISLNDGEPDSSSNGNNNQEQKLNISNQNILEKHHNQPAKQSTTAPKSLQWLSFSDCCPTLGATEEDEEILFIEEESSDSSSEDETHIGDAAGNVVHHQPLHLQRQHKNVLGKTNDSESDNEGVEYERFPGPATISAYCEASDAALLCGSPCMNHANCFPPTSHVICVDDIDCQNGNEAKGGAFTGPSGGFRPFKERVRSTVSFYNLPKASAMMMEAEDSTTPASSANVPRNIKG